MKTVTRCDLKTEQCLIGRAQKEDKEAAETLLLSYRPLLFTLARRLHCPWIPVEEFVQAGYLGLMQALKRFDPALSMRFITYALPWALGEMKRLVRKNANPYHETSFDYEMLDIGSSIADIVSGSENIDFVRLNLRFAISNLPEDEQKLIVLRYFRGKTQKETALLLLKSQTQISRMEQRAIERLHAMLRE